MDQKERFLELCGRVDRDGMDEFLAWLNGSDFFVAPASSRFHGAYVGGLLDHSLNVYDEAVRLLKAFPEVSDIPEDSLIISTLFHDVCKANFYTTEKRNRKNDKGQWESYDYYSIKEKFCFGGHGSKSVFILTQFMKLTPDEAVAINCHMGPWDGNEHVNSAYEQHPFAWIVHVADEAASFIDEKQKEEE